MNEMPADVLRAAAAAGETVSRETVAPAPVPATQTPRHISSHPANQGSPNRGRRAAEPATAPDSGGLQVSLASLLRGKQLTPEEDTTNIGWRFPKYIVEVIRLLSFQLKKDQQEIAVELLYSAMMDTSPSGVLSTVPMETIKKLLQASHLEQSKALGIRQDV